MGFLKNIGKNWKTSLSGAATLTLVGLRVAHGNFDYSTDAPLIILGIGQLFGKDSNVTGGTKPQNGGTVAADPVARRIDSNKI